MLNKIIAFDLDDVLCSRTSNEGDVDKYKSCEPNKEMIMILNKCYEKGHKIIIYTARGMTVFKGNVNDIYANLYEITKNQLDQWGVNYHQLIMGKVHFDLFIDDKAVNSNLIKNISDIDNYLKDVNSN